MGRLRACGPAPRYERFHPDNDLRRSHAEHIRKFDHEPNRGALHTALNKTDVGAVKTAIKRELLLRHAVFLADFPQGVAESAFRPSERLVLPLHSDLFAVEDSSCMVQIGHSIAFGLRFA